MKKIQHITIATQTILEIQTGAEARGIHNKENIISFQTILVGDPQIGASGSQGQGTDDDIKYCS
ncbi:MAG: hypothetical protein ACLUR5_08290 [Eubacterium ventriosum]